MNLMRSSPEISANSSAEEAINQATRLLEDVFARFQGELLGTLYYLVGNQEDARDALQETFLKCWRRRTMLPEVDNLKAWVFQVALNTGRDLRASAWKRKKLPLTGIEPMQTSSPHPATGMEEREQLDQLRQALRNLRPEEQEVFLLRQNAQLTYEQISDSIGIPVGTVKTRMRLALSKLRLALHVG